MSLEDKISKFTKDNSIDVGDLTLKDVNKIRKRFKIPTRANVLALLRQNKERRDILYEVYAADFYDKTPWMHRDRKAYHDRNKLFCLLYNNMDKLEHRDLSFLVLALKTGKKITKAEYKRWSSEAHAANYAIKNESIFTDEVRKAYRKMPEEEKSVPEKRLRYHLLNSIKHNRFRRIDNPEKAISEKYLKTALMYAILLYGNKMLKGK